MKTNIETIEDVRQFAEQLLAEGLSFHPDDNFEDYIHMESNKPFYTPDQAVLRNRLMEQSFEVCEKKGVDIYSIMYDYTSGHLLLTS